MEGKLKSQKLKIMQIAPHYLPITKKLRYGGIERRIFNLDKFFTKAGHSSFVVATGDSNIFGKLCVTLPKGSLVLKENNNDEGWRYDLGNSKNSYEEHCEMALDYINSYKPNIIHDQGGGFIQSEVFQKTNDLPPILCTLCGPLNPDNRKKFERLNEKVDGRNVLFSAQSKSHQEDFNKVMRVNYFVYNGVNIAEWPFQEKGEGFLFSLGLISQYKGQHIALDVAERLGKKIVLAGPIHDCVAPMRKYWDDEIKPNIDCFERDIPAEQVGNFIERFMQSDNKSVYVGELDDAQKKEFYKRTDTFIHPGTAKEAFCNTLIESMVCGTPVVAFNFGSVPELVAHGKTGYVINANSYLIEGSSRYHIGVSEKSIQDFVESVGRIQNISREVCRIHVAENFSLDFQVRNYLDVYKNILRGIKNE